MNMNLLIIYIYMKNKMIRKKLLHWTYKVK